MRAFICIWNPKNSQVTHRLNFHSVERKKNQFPQKFDFIKCITVSQINLTWSEKKFHSKDFWQPQTGILEREREKTRQLWASQTCAWVAVVNHVLVIDIEQTANGLCCYASSRENYWFYICLHFGRWGASERASDGWRLMDLLCTLLKFTMRVWDVGPVYISSAIDVKSYSPICAWLVPLKWATLFRFCLDENTSMCKSDFIL